MRAVLYIAAQLPKRSETFVYREVFGLRAAGLRVPVATLNPPETDLGDSRLDALAAEAIPVYGRGMPALFAEALVELLAHPVRGVATVFLAIRDALAASDLSLAGRLKTPVQAIAALALARRARGARIAHIHAHFAHAPATVAMYAAFQLGIPFSFTGHAVDLFRDRGLLREKLERALFVNCISEWHRGFYHQLVPRERTFYPIVRCGVDVHEFEFRARPRTECPVLLGVGRLVPKKGLDLLLDAAARLVKQGRDFRVQIAGDGPELESLRAQCGRLGLGDRVEFLGACANARVRGLMRDADIFVLPCRVDSSGDRDGIPVVLMEAMACGLPVVSGDLPTLRELVQDGVTGMLSPPESAPALSTLLNDLLGDFDKRAKLATEARRHVESEFSLDVNIARIINNLQTKQDPTT